MRLKICLLAVLIAISAFCQTAKKPNKGELPYHPYRKVGEKYYNVQPIYNWIKSGKTYPSRTCPMPDWFLADSYSSGPIDPNGGFAGSHYRVIGVKSDGLVIGDESISSTRGSSISNVLFLKNHPRQSEYVDGDRITFVAMKAGTYHYTTADHSAATVPCYDYGTPYNPWATAGTNGVKTNAVPGNSPAPR